MLNAIQNVAETQFIRANPEGKRRSDIIPAPSTAAKIYPGAVGDDPGFDEGIWRAEHDRIIMEIGVDVARRREERFEEFITRPVRGAPGPAEVATGVLKAYQELPL